MPRSDVKQTSRLLRLPPELRQRIYDHVLDDYAVNVFVPFQGKPHHIRPRTLQDGDKGIPTTYYSAEPHQQFHFIGPPTHVLVCDQFRQDFGRRWAREASYCCDSQLGFLELLRFLHARKIRHVHRVLVWFAEAFVLDVGSESARSQPAQSSDQQDNAHPTPATDTTPFLMPGTEFQPGAVGGLHDPLRAQVLLAQMVEAFDVSFDRLEVYSECLDQRLCDIGVHLTALLAPKCRSLVFYHDNNGARRKEANELICTGLRLVVDNVKRLETYSGDITESGMGELLQSLGMKEDRVKDAYCFIITEPNAEALAEERAEAIQMIGQARWDAGVQIARNWDIVERKARKFAEESAFSIVQAADDNPEEFLRRLQSKID